MLGDVDFSADKGAKMNDQVVAWMFRNPKTKNVVFFDNALEAEKFAETEPTWEIVFLTTVSLTGSFDNLNHKKEV